MAASAVAAGRAETGSARKRCRMPGKSRRASTRADLVGSEHVGGDEAAEGEAEPLLLVGDDRGMRDRDAERMAEQRGDREPIGDAAYKTCFCGGLEQVGGGRGGQGIATQSEDGHQNEEGGCEGPMAPQRAPCLGVGVRGDHARRRLPWRSASRWRLVIRGMRQFLLRWSTGGAQSRTNVGTTRGKMHSDGACAMRWRSKGG